MTQHSEAIYSFFDTNSFSTFQTSSSPSFSAYLRQLENVKLQLRQSVSLPSTLVFVMGNEASDMDSMAGSLILAYYLNTLHNTSSLFFSPLFNLPAADLRLRGEADNLLNTAGVSALKQIPFIDDVTLSHTQLASNRFKFILFDHNELASQQRDYAQHVIAVMDHHVDSQQHSAVGVSNYHVAPIGSCCSHLVNLIFQRQHQVALTLSLCELLLAVQLLDTHNFSAEYGKATADDLKARSSLLSHMCQLKYEDYSNYRLDISRLSVDELLRKDRKFFQCGRFRIQISSVPLSIREWTSKEQHLLHKFCEALLKQRDEVDQLFVMSASTEQDVFQRQFIAVLPQTKLNASSCFLSPTAIFPALESSELQLRLLGQQYALSTDECVIRCYLQLNVKHDRKKVAPALMKLLSKL